MARLHLPSVAIGFLMFIGAGLSGLLAFTITGGRTVGMFWSIAVFLGVLLMMVVVAVMRSSNESQAEQP